MFMLPIYCFLSFMFFKIMPEYLFDKSNTVLGALLMALVSTACMFGTTLWLNVTGLDAIDKCRRRHAGRPELSALILPAIIGIGASMGASYLVGVGFSKTLLKEVFDSYGYSRENLQIWFWIMLAIPPILQTCVVVADIAKLAFQVRHDPD